MIYLLDNWADPNAGMITNINWGWIYVQRMNYNRVPNGFTNWRFPTKAWVDDMFQGWTGTPGEFAKSQGLTPMDRERFLPLWMDPATCGTIDCEAKWALDHFYDRNYGFFYYRTTEGNTGWLNWMARNNLNLMPVREISSGERYCW